MEVDSISTAIQLDSSFKRVRFRMSAYSITTVLSRVLPGDVARQLVSEIRVFLKRSLYNRSSLRRLASLDGCRVNVGCGDRPTPGWINLELRSASNIHFWDCRRGLPFSDNAVKAIYAEHAFEHFDLDAEGKPFLRESLRCLRPGGVLRVVVPDAGAYLRAYGQAWESLASIRQLEAWKQGWRDPWLGDVYSTQMQLINAVFRQHGEHKYAYDRETLVLILRQAGFSQVIPQRFGVSIDRDMAPDSEARKTESLYIEAVK
jgi:predicted SAM-dependent methyltransferase